MIVKDLTVKGKTCGVDLVKLDVDCIRKGESDAYIMGETSFLTGFDVKNELNVSTVNSVVDLFSKIFTLNTPQNIGGDFHFGSNVYIEAQLSSNGYINDVSLQLLASIYSFENGTTHVLKYDVEAEDSLESFSLNVHKLVQGLDFQKYLSTSLVTLSSAVKVTGEKTFSQPISVQGDVEVYEVNGINVATFASSIILKSDSVRFSAPVIFENTVYTPVIQVLYGDILANGLVGDANLTELIEQAVYTNSRRSAGSLSFETIEVIGNIDDVKYLNDIKLEDIITLYTSQQLGTLNVKEARLEGRNVEVNGLILGYNLPIEFARTLFVSQNLFFFLPY